jgi:hypothetical protein
LKLRRPLHPSDRVRPTTDAGRESIHYFRLGVGVGIHVRPLLSSQLSLDGLVAQPIFGRVAKPLSEGQHTFYLAAALREHVHVDIQLGRSEHSVLVPLGFPNTQLISSPRQQLQVRTFVT